MDNKQKILRERVRERERSGSEKSEKGNGKKRRDFMVGKNNR